MANTPKSSTGTKAPLTEIELRLYEEELDERKSRIESRLEENSVMEQMIKQIERRIKERENELKRKKMGVDNRRQGSKN